MAYDIIIISGESYFDHPLCGVAIIRRLLEKRGYKVAVIDSPKRESEVTRFGRPRLFFGITSGSIDSMVRNYTPLKKLRKDDANLHYNECVPDRAVIVYCNWVRKNYKDSIMVLGGVEASLRRFTHYDYWANSLRKSILLDSRADIIAYGSAEKQTLEIARRIQAGQSLEGIEGTCILSREVPKGFSILPSHDEVRHSNEKFCHFQSQLSNRKSLAQKQDSRYVLQYKSPSYTNKDLDEYYRLPFTRRIRDKSLRGFEFSVVTHRGCFGACSFCSLSLTQGDRVISRSEESILNEIGDIAKLSHFRGQIDDLGGPSANMYGMDCNECEGVCLSCTRLNRKSKRWIGLLRSARQVPGIKKVFIRSGVRYELMDRDEIREVVAHHVFDTLRIAPEHVSKDVLRLMNKDCGSLAGFIKDFDAVKSGGKELSFYFMVAHPGSMTSHALELARFVRGRKNAEYVQVFTPTPMTNSTAMYYTGMEPKTLRKVYVPYTYNEKKEQKRLVMAGVENAGKNIEQVRDEGDEF